MDDKSKTSHRGGGTNKTLLSQVLSSLWSRTLKDVSKWSASDEGGDRPIFWQAFNDELMEVAIEVKKGSGS